MPRICNNNSGVPSSLPVFTFLLHSLCFASVSRAVLVAVVASLLAQVCSTEGAKHDPNRSQVVRITATSDADVKFVKQLRHKFNLDAWRELHQVNTTGDFFVPSHLARGMRHFLKLHGIPFTVLIRDTDRFISKYERQEATQRQRRSVTEDRYRYKFLTYNQMNSFLTNVQYKAKRANVHIGFIGRSFEGRDVPYVKITSTRNPTPKEIIFIDGGIHSREWISPAMALEIIHRLALNTEQDPQVDQLLDIYNFIVVPLVNPDGYAYTFLLGVFCHIMKHGMPGQAVTTLIHTYQWRHPGFIHNSQHVTFVATIISITRIVIVTICTMSIVIIILH
ncbi:carboxypeptidase [Elysia marginata]|uniref:Carboxypeptidase n=1 Tax=Elysia marginata TaxID=1093978 RepID=A0AAV4J1Y3_9GAST|nr:carboxypeptidase [Elysia marginata]